jgi:hypothetical protein
MYKHARGFRGTKPSDLSTLKRKKIGSGIGPNISSFLLVDDADLPKRLSKKRRRRLQGIKADKMRSAGFSRSPLHMENPQGVEWVSIAPSPSPKKWLRAAERARKALEMAKAKRELALNGPALTAKGGPGAAQFKRSR